MMAVRPRWLVVLAVLTLAPAPLPAGALRPAVNENPPVLINIAKDSKDVLTLEEKNRFGDLREGKRPIVDGTDTARNREVLAKAARWYAMRHTRQEIYENTLEPPNRLADVLSLAYQQLLLNSAGERLQRSPEQLAAQAGYLKEYSREFINCLREVLSKDGTMIVRVNSARLLTAVALAGVEEVADTLLELIADPGENGAVKLWAFRGLKELLAQGTPQKAALEPDRERKIILALLDAAATPIKLPDETPPEEIDAVSYVRREAVRALAQSRYPLLPKAEPGTGQTALVLLRIMRKDGIVPEPSLGEQAEAALGLLRMQAQASPGYQPDYVGYQIGLFLVDFLSQYNKARAGAVTGFPFNVWAARLTDNLEELKAQARTINPPPPGMIEFLTELTAKGKDALKPVAVDPKSKDQKNAEPEALDAWLRQVKPPEALYKGLTGAVLKTGG